MNPQTALTSAPAPRGFGRSYPMRDPIRTEPVSGSAGRRVPLPTINAQTRLPERRDVEGVLAGPGSGVQ